MTFRNIAFIFLSLILLSSCKGVQYFKSAINPAGISVILECPSTFYPKNSEKDSISFYLVNHNSQEIIVPHWWSDLQLIGQSRFYKKELTIRPQPLDLKMKATVISAGDSVLLIKLPFQTILGKDKNWTFKSKASLGPHILSLKKHHPYIYLTAEFSTRIPNQEEMIKIRSEKLKVNIKQWIEPSLTNKKTILSLTSTVQTFNQVNKEGALNCQIKNIGQYPIPLFNDPGSVRFKLYAYNPNRTATMYIQYILDNGRLPMDAININTGSEHTIQIALSHILFIDKPEDSIYYWTWNKKTPPTSPLVYGKNDLAKEVEFWFGIVVDGQEFLSNTILLDIVGSNKLSDKK